MRSLGPSAADLISLLSGEPEIMPKQRDLGVASPQRTLDLMACTSHRRGSGDVRLSALPVFKSGVRAEGVVVLEAPPCAGERLLSYEHYRGSERGAAM